MLRLSMMAYDGADFDTTFDVDVFDEAILNDVAFEEAAFADVTFNDGAFDDATLITYIL